MKFASHRVGFSASQSEMLSRLEDLLYAREGSEQSMLEMASQHGFEACGLSDDENCLLDAVVDQLNRLRKVTDSEELRQEAVTYLERYRQLDDGTELQNFVNDEEWDKYLDEMRENHYCDHLMLLALATVLRRSVVLYSGAETNREPVYITPDNVERRLRPIHIGHVSRLTFVTLRPTTVQQQDDEIPPDDDDDSIIQEDEAEEDDAVDIDGYGAVQFQHFTAGETSRWNVCSVFSFRDYYVGRVERKS